MHHPTYTEFVVHARKFGSECVLEAARAYLSARELCELELELIQLDGSHRARRRPTTPALVWQVHALAERGLVAAAIADCINLSDRRVRAILATRPTPENGGRKRLRQATQNVELAEGRPGRCSNGARAENGSYGLAAQLALEPPEERALA